MLVAYVHPFGNWKPLQNLITPHHAIALWVQLEEKVLPSPMDFPAQSMVASHPSGVDGYSEDSVSEAPIYVQPTSTHDHVITSPDEHLNWPRLILMAKGQPQ